MHVIFSVALMFTQASFTLRPPEPICHVAVPQFFISHGIHSLIQGVRYTGLFPVYPYCSGSDRVSYHRCEPVKLVLPDTCNLPLCVP